MNHVATTPARPRGQSLIAKAVSMAVNSGAFAAEENPVKVTMLQSDLEEAVDQIIDTAKAEGQTNFVQVETKVQVSAEEQAEKDAQALKDLKAAEAEKLEKEIEALDAGKIFEFNPVKNKEGRYRLVSPKLRDFIHDSMDTRIVERNMLELDSDDEATKQARLRISVQPVELYFQYMHDFSPIDADDIENSSSGLTMAEYQKFFRDLSARFKLWNDKRVEEARIKHENHMAAFNSGIVSFEDLYVGLKEAAKKNELYRTVHAGQNIAGKVLMVRREKSMFGEYLGIMIQIHSCNTDGLTPANHHFQIGAFADTASVDSFGLSKVDVNSDESKAMIERGAKYLSFVKTPTYLACSGEMYRKVGRTVEYINAKGRVMVDLQGMEDMDTNYDEYFSIASTGHPVVPFNVAEASDEIKLTCSPFVYGFSFKAKRWGQMNVVDMTPIKFRENAYEMLVLDQGTKDLIFASVTDTSADNDFIAGKGGGSINLLEGPPGVGKTLTAEAVAEMLKKPLYMVSVGELGTNVAQLENNLKDILEIAATWNAILLLDEADIFLETRDKHDVVRNAMVAVFLRLLEYYQGVMFLTTNRADNLDPAFESRISLCIHYEELSEEARREVWTNLMKAAKLGQTIDLDAVAKYKLNGRQIKGVIKSAKNLARFNEEDLNIDHFKSVIKQKEDFKSAAVYKLGHGLDDHVEEAEIPKANLLDRFVNWVVGYKSKK